MTVSYTGDAETSAGADDADGLVEVGDIVGPYRLVRLLGEGTTGRVFEVEHLRIGRRAAMKIVHDDCVPSRAVKRMFAEAEAVNAIGNPHIVEVTDLLVPTSGQAVHALVMELLEGTVLADVIANREPLPIPRLLPIMAQICDALSAVHAAGFVHRDLKPANIFLIERDGQPDFVKLLDFGLVKASHPNARPTATVEGTFLGSPAYASPEQASGKPVDWRTDIYAAGVMLYELVTGQLPFQAAGIADVLFQQITVPAPHLPEALLSTELGRVLDDVIQTCLAKDPEQRAIPATQLADFFSKLATGSVVSLDAARRWRPRFRSARKLATIAPVLALGAAAAIIATSMGRGDGAAPSRQPAGVSAAAAVVAPAPETKTAPPVDATRQPSSMSRPTRRPTRVPDRVGSAFTLDPYRR